MREVIDAILSTAARAGGRVALGDDAGTLSYGALADTLAGAMRALADTPPVVGVMMGRDRGHVIADLALAALGRTIVTLPDFFSPGQWAHMIRDAGIGAVVTNTAGAARLAGLGAPVRVPIWKAGGPLAPVRAARRIVYTSGTTGAPKGVVLGESQMAASLAALAAAAVPTADDIHLSVLPFSLLLEQLAGLLLPLRAGARIEIAADAASALTLAARVGATTTVVVPAVLAGWVAGLRQGGLRAPGSLRFVAAGGAPVGAELAQAAWDLGLPVHEGYGLSECCSVVAVNRPGQRRAGTVGRPLAGIGVHIDDGEIVVQGPTVMVGYLGGDAAGGVWRTGDCGRLNADGTLEVLGRKDDMVVTPGGRNFHPEWVEPLLLADPAVRACGVVADVSGSRAVLVPAAGIGSDPVAWLGHLRALCQSLPDYARPNAVSLLTPAEVQAHGLFTIDGRPRRRRILNYVKETSMSFLENLVAETTAQRQDFLAIPVISRALAQGVEVELYRAFLDCAYHHVRHTVPLLRRALAACAADDEVLARGLRDYIAEEDGHDAWILDDIAALGGDARASRDGRPPVAVRALVATAYHLIEEEGPYALLGMVHVLEGMSVALAIPAAQAIQARLGTGAAGFSYLTSHGGLDVGHVEGFAQLLDAIDSPARRRTVISAARDFYVLYGNVFRSLAVTAGPVRDAA